MICVWPPCLRLLWFVLSWSADGGVERRTSHYRYLAATRDIKPGEVILKEAPLIVGPRLEGAPVCMGCFNVLATPHTCSNCHLAELCSPACESNPNHAGKECELLGESGYDCNLQLPGSYYYTHLTDFLEKFTNHGLVFCHCGLGFDYTRKCVKHFPEFFYKLLFYEPFQYFSNISFRIKL